MAALRVNTSNATVELHEELVLPERTPVFISCIEDCTVEITVYANLVN